jgi:hypothetical protein
METNETNETKTKTINELPDTFRQIIHGEKARHGREIKPDLASLMSGTGCAARVRHNVDKIRSLIDDTVKTIAIAMYDHNAALLPETLRNLAAAAESMGTAANWISPDWGRPALRIDARVRLTENAPILAFMPIRLDRENKRVRPLFTITAIDEAAGKVTLSDRYTVPLADIELVK